MTSNQIKRPLGLQLLIYGFVLLWLIVAAFPFFWTMWGSFKVELDFSVGLVLQRDLETIRL
mgnify:CR=1 FL=1